VGFFVDVLGFFVVGFFVGVFGSFGVFAFGLAFGFFAFEAFGARAVSLDSRSDSVFSSRSRTSSLRASTLPPVDST